MITGTLDILVLPFSLAHKKFVPEISRHIHKRKARGATVFC